MTDSNKHPLAALAGATSQARARELASSAGMTQRQAVEFHKSVQAKRTERSKRAPRPDPYPVQVRYRATSVSAAYIRAGYKTAAHDHDWKWHLSDSPRAESVSGSDWASKLGLSSAYQKKAYRVATSRHSIYVSRTWLRDVQARGIAVVDGMLTLACESTPDLSARADGTAFRAIWARQGRGTSLVTEKGWLVRSGTRWTHASSVRSARSVGGYVPQAESHVGPLSDCLELDPLVTYRDARAAGLCQAGIRDWAARHTDGSLRPVRAKVLWRIAQSTGDRESFVERAIRQAAGRVLAERQAKAE